tara:strand:+ start:1490 stop:2911 length:1422 start_codon:yes stop_codon:yes gene_type:complete
MFSRRTILANTLNGLGMLALTDILQATEENSLRPFAPRPQHISRKAKRCIFVFMQGGVSQMDSFEYKPELNRYHGKRIPGSHDVRGELQGRISHPHSLVGSPFKFRQYGQSQRYVSELFPRIAGHIDKLAFIHGIETDNPNHGPSTLHVTTGSQFPGSASLGSWVTYGLGTQNDNMPAYMVVQDPRGAPVNGAHTWGNGFLPAAYQGTLLRNQGTPILNLDLPRGLNRERQRGELDQLRKFNKRFSQKYPDATELEARIEAYELAYRMQTTAPDLVDLSKEPEHIHKLYGLDNPQTEGFGRQCLMARRLAESGVRYTMLIHGVQIGGNSWDHHGDVKGRMIRQSAEVDTPVAALLTDLQQRDMLQDTLVVWASEMGRTPFVPGSIGGSPGRDHNKYGLVMWMAGGNVKAGATIGGTDDFSLRAAEEPIHIRNVHATLLDLMGLDDELLRYLHAGRYRRLTDIGGEVLHDMIDA